MHDSELLLVGALVVIPALSLLLRLRNEGTISNDVMHRIERDLDLEETRLRS